MNSAFEKKKIVTEIDRAINETFSIDTGNDADFLSTEKYSWDDLEKLKTELGNSILEFIGQVNVVITNREIIAKLGEKRTHFEKLVTLFFSDVNEFSNKVKNLRLQHEGKTGHINDINEFDQYNRIAIGYHSLFTELSALVTPTLSDIILTVSEVIPNAVIQTEELQPVDKE
jgi:hypothetical protein